MKNAGSTEYLRRREGAQSARECLDEAGGSEIAWTPGGGGRKAKQEKRTSAQKKEGQHSLLPINRHGHLRVGRYVGRSLAGHRFGVHPAGRHFLGVAKATAEKPGADEMRA